MNNITLPTFEELPRDGYNADRWKDFLDFNSDYVESMTPDFEAGSILITLKEEVGGMPVDFYKMCVEIGCHIGTSFKEFSFNPVSRTIDVWMD
jgi:hypothetical protein